MKTRNNPISERIHEIRKNNGIRVQIEYRSEPYDLYGERGNGDLSSKSEVIPYLPMKARILQKSQKGFSTIIAILMTAFLVILSAGILNLFLVENGISHFLSDGISAYMGAEGSLEYALLKSANHREGFSDSITKNDQESLLLTGSHDLINRKTEIFYDIKDFDTSYSGSIEQGAFEIIPLFYDSGALIQTNAKNPNTSTSHIVKTANFLVTMDGDLTWNIIGNDGSGTTNGIVGTGGVGKSFGNDASADTRQGFRKQMESGTMTAKGNENIGTFLSTYENNYLILSNTSENTIHYRIIDTTGTGFSLPVRSIIASSSVGKSRQNIEFQENRSWLFDMLKYSLFNK